MIRDSKDWIPEREVAAILEVPLWALRRYQYSHQMGFPFASTGGGEAVYRKSEIEQWLRDHAPQTGVLFSEDDITIANFGLVQGCGR